MNSRCEYAANATVSSRKTLKPRKRPNFAPSLSLRKSTTPRTIFGKCPNSRTMPNRRWILSGSAHRNPRWPPTEPEVGLLTVDFLTGARKSKMERNNMYSVMNSSRGNSTWMIIREESMFKRRTMIALIGIRRSPLNWIKFGLDLELIIIAFWTLSKVVMECVPSDPFIFVLGQTFFYPPLYF